MGHGEYKNYKSGRLAGWKAIAAILFLLVAAVSGYAFQEDKPADKQSTEQQSPGLDLQKNQALLQELVLLLNKIQHGVQVPALRTQSRLLSVLPPSTNVYFALPNYGEALKQADDIFHEQLQERPVLNEYWQQVGMGGFIVESAVDKIHEFMQYIGNELVVSSTVTQQGPSFFVVAEIKKPGLKVFLQSLLSQFGGTNLPVRVLSPQELLTAKSTRSSKQSFALVRPDFVVFATDLPSLKKFNTQLNSGASAFATSAFGQRLSQSYKNGVGILLGADLQQLLALRPKGTEQNEAVLRKTGFGDVKFLTVEYKSDSGQSLTNAEVSFNGPRQGIASWLAAPGPNGALDFFSPSSSYAAGGLIKSPVQIFDDIKSLVETANPASTNGLSEVESELKINLRDDLFGKFLGEFGFGLDGQNASLLPWKAVFKVSDPNGLQQTIAKLVAAANSKEKSGKGISLKQHTEKGMSYHTVSFANGPKHEEIVYTFGDGYLIAADNKGQLADAIESHRSGNSLGKSGEFHALLPQEHSDCSAVAYDEPRKMLASIMQFMAKENPQAVQQLEGLQNWWGGAKVQPIIQCFYGEPSAIRMSTNSGLMMLSGGLIGSAIVIPNLMSSRVAANEAAAASNVRSVNMVQMSYSSGHPTLGYAASFKSLGTDSPVHCSADGSCIRDSFRYSLSAVCEKDNCKDYVVMATPVSSNGGGRSFCSTSDAVVRSRQGPVTSEQIDVEECQSWAPM